MPDNDGLPIQSASNNSLATGVRRYRLTRRVVARVILMFVVTVAGLFMISMSSTPPADLGVRGGQLAKCPTSPNCVSTQAESPDRRMPSIAFSSSSQEIQDRLRETVKRVVPRAKLVSESGNYLHYEVTSLIFRFVDDVEFFVDDDSKQIHFRSASRVGYSDMGVNRKRMQRITDEMKP